MSSRVEITINHGEGVSLAERNVITIQSPRNPEVSVHNYNQCWHCLRKTCGTNRPEILAAVLVFLLGVIGVAMAAIFYHVKSAESKNIVFEQTVILPPEIEDAIISRDRNSVVSFANETKLGIHNKTANGSISEVLSPIHYETIILDNTGIRTKRQIPNVSDPEGHQNISPKDSLIHETTLQEVQSNDDFKEIINTLQNSFQNFQNSQGVNLTSAVNPFQTILNVLNPLTKFMPNSHNSNITKNLEESQEDSEGELHDREGNVDINNTLHMFLDDPQNMEKLKANPFIKSLLEKSCNESECKILVEKMKNSISKMQDNIANLTDIILNFQQKKTEGFQKDLSLEIETQHSVNIQNISNPGENNAVLNTDKPQFGENSSEEVFDPISNEDDGFPAILDDLSRNSFKSSVQGNMKDAFAIQNFTKQSEPNANSHMKKLSKENLGASFANKSVSEETQKGITDDKFSDFPNNFTADTMHINNLPFFNKGENTFNHLKEETSLNPDLHGSVRVISKPVEESKMMTQLPTTTEGVTTSQYFTVFPNFLLPHSLACFYAPFFQFFTNGESNKHINIFQNIIYDKSHKIFPSVYSHAEDFHNIVKPPIYHQNRMPLYRFPVTVLWSFSQINDNYANIVKHVSAVYPLKQNGYIQMPLQKNPFLNPLFCIYLAPPLHNLRELLHIPKLNADNYKIKSFISRSREGEYDKQTVQATYSPAEEERSISGLPGSFPEQKDITKCPEEHTVCKDKSRCIPMHMLCDRVIDCQDASDEINCSCRIMVEKERLCDGYFDCPFGEDEVDCSGES